MICNKTDLQRDGQKSKAERQRGREAKAGKLYREGGAVEGDSKCQVEKKIK